MSRPLSSEDAFRAIAHPLRRRIIHQLISEPRAAGELAREFNTSWPTVSRHLATLRECGVVSQKRVGSRRVYRLRNNALATVLKWSAGYRQATTAVKRQKK